MVPRGRRQLVAVSASPRSSLVVPQVVERYGLRFGRTREDLFMAGSPERCEYRVVVQDGERRLYLVEQLARETLPRKRLIAQTLAHLDEEGLAGVVPYLRNEAGAFVTSYGPTFWQLRPYVTGEPLPRPGWVRHAWRGRTLARFLVNLRTTSAAIPYHDGQDSFSIVEYINELMVSIETNRPGLSERLELVLAYLRRELFAIHGTLPAAFCHGDFHPVNVIWAKHGIAAVIDWEFCGLKPDLYDVANLLGCVGIEEPAALTGALVNELIPVVRDVGIISSESWPHLLPYMVALRFAWMSEWLRRSDEKMIELELVYMGLLMDRRAELERAWGI